MTRLEAETQSKEFWMPSKHILLTITCGTFLLSHLANGDEASKVESVLDKLEQRLIDKESSPLDVPNDGEENARKLPATTKNIPTLRPSKPQVISGKTPAMKNIKEIQSKINDFDTRIEVLESELRQLRSELYDASTTDNQVMFEVKASDESKFMIRTLTAKLDGFTLYSQLDPGGLWMPSRSVPIFFGPLQPGDHRIDVTATIAPVSPDGIELTTWKQKSLNQSFNFSVPPGKSRQNLAVVIADSKGDNSQPVASILGAEIK